MPSWNRRLPRGSPRPRRCPTTRVRASSTPWCWGRSRSTPAGSGPSSGPPGDSSATTSWNSPSPTSGPYSEQGAESASSASAKISSGGTGMNHLRFGTGLMLAGLLLAAGTASADVKTTEKSQLKFEGMLGKMMGLFGGKAAKEGTVTTVAVKGDRKITSNEDSATIIDLAEEKV